METKALLSDKKTVLNQRWFVVGPPWGDRTFIRAGAEDAAGEFVIDRDHSSWNAPELTTVTDHEVISHIANLHNMWLSMDSKNPFYWRGRYNAVAQQRDALEKQVKDLTAAMERMLRKIEAQAAFQGAV